MTDLITQGIERFGYFGIALLMALENVFPPVPSELIMPFAGFVAGKGDLHIVGVILAGAIGSVVGTLPWFWLGRRIGQERLARWVKAHGRWFTVTPQELERAERWFERRGGWALLVGRLVPAVRSIISMPAGFSGMSVGKMIAWSSIGTLIWSGALALLGFWLGSRFEQVSPWVDRASLAILAFLVASYVWRVVRFDPDGGK
ncbi:MAG TPA: DedA family protein [Ramlibacter sp.]|jgi:membrane protein DedA with SNARE-associated domain|nr:DedA family protein [Ramlibacter sp.]